MSEVLGFADLIGQVAARIAATNPSIDRADVEQECWLELLEQRQRVGEIDPDDQRRFVNRVVSNKAVRWTMREVSLQAGSSSDDQHQYRPEQVKVLLPLVFAYADGELPGACGQGEGMPRGQEDPAVGGNLMPMILDVSSGLASISREERKLLTRLFDDGLSVAEVAAELQELPNTIRARQDRAVKNLIVGIDGFRRPDGPGSRRVMSRAAGVAAVSLD